MLLDAFYKVCHDIQEACYVFRVDVSEEEKHLEVEALHFFSSLVLTASVQYAFTWIASFQGQNQSSVLCVCTCICILPGTEWSWNMICIESVYAQ